MKSAVTYGYLFTPAARTIDMSAIPDFDVRKLYAIINVTRQRVMYATGLDGHGYSEINGALNVLTLECNTQSMDANDLIQIIYDDTSVETNQVLAGRYLATEPTLSDGETAYLRVNEKGELVVEDDEKGVFVLNLGDIEFPAVQPVVGDRVNNESVTAYSPSSSLPSKVTMVGGRFDSSEVHPIRVEDDGTVFVRPSVTFPVSGPLTDTELRAAPVPVNQTQVGGANVTLGRKTAALSIPHVMANEDILDQYITGAGPNQPPVNTNILLAVTATFTPLDCQQYRSIAVQVNCGAGTDSVTVNFEGSNDGVTFFQVLMKDMSSPLAAPTAAFNTATNSVRFFEGPIYFRYFRARTSSGAVTAGSVRAFTILRMSPWQSVTNLLPTTQTLQSIGTVTNITANNNAAGIVSIIASAAITSTATSAAFTLANLQSQGYIVAVTAVSGTNPTLDISIEETYNGTNWHKIYDMERITTTGAYRTPIIPTAGSQYRVVRTVGGTTPSFTMSMVATNRATSLNRNKRLIDRTIDPNTLNSVTPAFEVRDCSKIQIVQCSNAGAIVVPVLTLQGSEDNLEWYDLPCILTCTASTNSVASITLGMCAFVRLKVTTAGTSAVLKYVSITAQ
jgi:hypothetical protein